METKGHFIYTLLLFWQLEIILQMPSLHRTNLSVHVKPLRGLQRDGMEATELRVGDAFKSRQNLKTLFKKFLDLGKYEMIAISY